MYQRLLELALNITKEISERPSMSAVDVEQLVTMEGVQGAVVVSAVKPAAEKATREYSIKR